MPSEAEYLERWDISYVLLSPNLRNRHSTTNILRIVEIMLPPAVNVWLSVIVSILIRSGYCQSSQLVDTTKIDGPVRVGTELDVSWTGGSPDYAVTFTLKQGDLGHLVTIVELSCRNYFGYECYVPPTTANGNYTIELDQDGSTPVYTPYFTIIGGGLPLSSTSINQSPSSTSASFNKPSAAASSTITTSTTAFPTTLISASSLSTSSSAGTTASSTSSASSQPYSPSTTNPLGDSFLTGSCTIPEFAVATNTHATAPFEYPFIGCSSDRQGCCPPSLAGQLDVKGLPNIYGGVSECPGGYYTATVSSSPSSLCCPTGWAPFLGTLDANNLITPCYTPLSSPLPRPTDTSATFNGQPVIIDNFVLDTLFTAAFVLTPQTSGLSKGAIAGIAVGSVIGAAAVGIALFFCFRLRKKRRYNNFDPHPMIGQDQLEQGTDTNKIAITRKPVAEISQLQRGNEKTNTVTSLDERERAVELSPVGEKRAVELSPVGEKRAEELSSDSDKKAELNGRNNLDTVYELEVNR